MNLTFYDKTLDVANFKKAFKHFLHFFSLRNKIHALITPINSESRHAAEFRDDPTEERSYDDVPNGFFMPHDDHILPTKNFIAASATSRLLANNNNRTNYVEWAHQQHKFYEINEDSELNSSFLNR